jgi:hypothetical protein
MNMKSQRFLMFRQVHIQVMIMAYYASGTSGTAASLLVTVAAAAARLGRELRLMLVQSAH